MGAKETFCAPFIHNGATLEREIVGYIRVIGSPTRNKLKNLKNDKIQLQNLLQSKATTSFKKLTLIHILKI